jgi:hypothetical protein
VRPSKELIAEWYAKLKASGFVDAEETDRFGMPLVDKHNSRFATKRYDQLRADAEEYQAKVEAFLHSQALTDLCTLIDDRKGSAYTGDQARLVWEMHCDGRTEKDTATSIGFSKSRVHRILTQLRTWMDLQ